MTTTTRPMADHALKYAFMGWQVFPIREAGEAYKSDGIDKIATGREPGTAKGFKDATTDPMQIGKWWTSKPTRGMAVRTCQASGIWVLDSDDGGEVTIAALEAEHGSLPETPMQRTPSGGIHRVFAWPDDGLELARTIRFLKNTAHDINGNGGGLDALGERPGGRGGYFIVAPSTRPDGRYEWIVSPDDCAPAMAPDWLLELVRHEKTERNPDAPRIAPVKSGSNTAYGEKILEENAREVRGCPPGSQNDTLFRRACRVGSIAYGGSLDVNYAMSVMVDAGLSMMNAPGKPAWQRSEIEALVRRGFDVGKADPNARPERAPYSGVPGRDDVPAGYDPETGEFIEERHDELPVEAPQPDKPKPRNNDAFQCLGYNRGAFYYLPRGTGQIVALRASEHTPLRLLELAGLDYWQALNHGEKLGKDVWQGFANALMRKCEDGGIFDEGRLRGRGAWIDGKQVIVNTGSEARIGSKSMPLTQVASRFIYEAGDPWEFGYGQAASSTDANRVKQICERLTWADPMSGALMCGWCVIAPVAGALDWRSHIWVTGPSGSGKTTALDIILRLVGPASEKVDGKVTEAAIRQLMGFDARPVIFDEAEGEDEASALRMQQILDLARSASSGARIPKGGTNGVAKIYIMRSPFCFSSINTSVRHKADESRISKLVLVPNTHEKSDDHYMGLVRDIDAWFTPEFASAMFLRTVENLPTLLANIKTFETAAAHVFRSRRAANQIAPMLAGYYLCHKTDAISADLAAEFIRRHDWGDYVALNAETDEMRLLQYIITRPIKVYVQGKGTLEMTIGTAIDEARTENGRGPYREALGMVGIKVDTEFVGISDSADNTRALLKGMTQWQADWKRPLRSIPGAIKSSTSERFIGGGVSRLTWIPMGHFTGNYREREIGEEG